MQCLSEIVVDGKDITIKRNVYWEQIASVRIMNELSDEMRIQRGVRQGCVAYPTLFNLYTETIFRHIINMKGVNVGGKHFKNHLVRKLISRRPRQWLHFLIRLHI